MAGFGEEGSWGVTRCSGPLVNGCGPEGGASRAPAESGGSVIEDGGHQSLCRCTLQLVHQVILAIEAGL